MPEEKKISEIGLSEFVSTLIRETFDAILTAQEEQSAKVTQIIQIAQSAPSEVVSDIVTTEEAEAAMKKFFPSVEDPFCSVYEGGDYRPEPTETPAIYNLIGYKMLKTDFADGKITASGYQAVKHQVMLMLANEKLQQIREMVRYGLPKIQVDNGKIIAKVAFSVKETETEGDEPTKTATRLPTTFLQKIDVMSGKTLKRIQVPAARMMVKQATDTGNSSANSTSIYGEVEIHFRSVQ